jgi:hypothetical protein
MNIKQEDLVRFWTWCGFDAHAFPQEFSLDLIYQYAVPRLQDKGYSITLIAYERNEFGAGIFDEVHDVSMTEINRCDSPTEALFNAIMKVIENEQSNK